MIISSFHWKQCYISFYIFFFPPKSAIIEVDFLDQRHKHFGYFFFFFHFGYFENTFKIFSVEVLYQSIFLFSYALKYTTLTHFPSHVATLIRLEMYCFWLPRIFPPSFPFFRSWCLTLLVIRVIIRPDLTNHNPLWNGCVIQAEPIRVLPWDLYTNNAGETFSSASFGMLGGYEFGAVCGHLPNLERSLFFWFVFRMKLETNRNKP